MGLLFSVMACKRQTYSSKELIQAEELMQLHPNSALTILRQFNSHSFIDSANIAAYALFRTQADDKNYIDKTSDSLIKIAVRYYDRHGDDLQKAKAHYYFGRIYQNRGDNVHTAEQFLTALPYAKRAKADRLLCNIKSNLGFLLWDEGLYEVAGSIYEQLIPLELQFHDIEGVAISELKLGDIFMQLKNPDYISSERHLKQSFLYSNRFNNKNIRYSIIYSLSILNDNMNKPNKALSYAKACLPLSVDSLQLYDSYLIMGAAYAKLNRNDSATVYLKRSILSTNHDVKEQAYQMLASISRKRGDKDRLIYYNDKYITYRDSVQSRKSPAKVVSVIKDLVHRQSEEEHRISYMQLMYSILFPIVLIILFLITLYYKNVRRQLKLEIERHRTAQQNRQQIDKLIDYKVNERLKQQLNHLSLREQISSLPIYQRLIEVRNYNESESEKDKRKQLNDGEWSELIKAISMLLPDFVDNLDKRCESLTAKDIRFCCLVCSDFYYAEIAYILGCTPQAVDYRKKVIMRKLGIDFNTKLEEVIKKL